MTDKDREYCAAIADTCAQALKTGAGTAHSEEARNVAIAAAEWIAHEIEMACPNAPIPRAIVDMVNLPNDEHKRLIAILNEWVTCPEITGYDNSECWGCGELKTSPHLPDCLLGRSIDLLKEVGAING